MDSFLHYFEEIKWDMNTNLPRISIITVNYNQLELTCALLDSIRAVQYLNCEIWVVDNASKENPTAYLHKNYPEVNVIVSLKNLGFAGGNNLAVRQCTGEFIFFINNDAELTKGCLKSLINLFKSEPKLGIVSPLICYYPSEETQHQEIIQYAGTTPVNNYTARNQTIGAGEPFTKQFDQPYPTAYVHGAAMMTSRKALEVTGMMNEEFFLYYEELDWSEQIRKAGFELMVEPRAYIYHKESVSIGKASPLKTYYLNRNRILFMRRHRTTLQVLIFSLFLTFFTIPKHLLLFAIKGEWSHIKAFTKAIWWNITHPNAGKVIKNEINPLSKHTLPNQFIKPLHQ